MVRSSEPSGETIRQLLDIAPDAIAVVERGVVLYMSPTGARMLGYPSSEAVRGKSMAEWLHPDDVPLAAARIGEVMAKGRGFDVPQEYRARTRDGRALLAEVASVPITYEGRPAVLAFVRDVTERKALERRLAQAERLASLGRLSAGVAHEINNPLAHVMLAVEYVRGLMAEAQPDDLSSAISEAREALDEIAANLERMAAVTRELRLFASSEPVTRGPADLAELLERSLLSVRAVRTTSGVSIETDFGSAPPALADPGRLEQVFINLLSNAFDVLGESPPLARKCITVRLSSSAQRAIVEITDSGPGVPPDALERLFEPFFSTKPFGKGAGLGLSISRNIVEAHDGSLTVSSLEGHGTTFTVSLPLAEPLAEPLGARSPKGSTGRDP
jgi:two-component system, NtrC family, sensor kinase